MFDNSKPKFFGYLGSSLDDAVETPVEMTASGEQMDVVAITAENAKGAKYSLFVRAVDLSAAIATLNQHRQQEMRSKANQAQAK